MGNLTILNKTNFSDITKEQLADNFKSLISDAEALIKATANQGGDAVAAVRHKTERSLALAKARMAEAELILKARTRVAARKADNYVHDNAWQTIGVAAGVGFLLGLVVGMDRR